MKLNSKENKVKKYFFVENAGKYYVDENSEIVKKLNEQGKKALFGIQNRKGIYTIIGEHFVYYLTVSGNKGEISHKDFINELDENSSRIGKNFFKMMFFYKNIILKNKDKIWLHNANTMFSLWSIILWLEEEERKRIFRNKNAL